MSAGIFPIPQVAPVATLGEIFGPLAGLAALVPIVVFLVLLVTHLIEAVRDASGRSTSEVASPVRAAGSSQVRPAA